MTNPVQEGVSTSLYQEALDGFRRLLEEAAASGDPEPTAMTLATSQGDRVDARVVLLKGVDADGFRLFTNYESAKGRQLAEHPRAALCFHWKTLREGVQVRVEGRVERLSAEQSDAYFASRARGSQIGAWASLQSQPLRDRAEFEARIATVELRYADAAVPRPPHWGGFLVVPDSIEFWYGARHRLHERVRYERVADAWAKQHLYP